LKTTIGQPPGRSDHAFPLQATPTKLQARAFALLEIDPTGSVAMQVTGSERRKPALSPYITGNSCLTPK